MGRAKMGTLSAIVGSRPLGVVVESANGVFVADIEDQTVSRHLAHGEYGTDELNRIRTLVTADSDVLIVGGHIGSLAIPIAQYAAHVDVIEANPASFRLLQMNRSINDSKNITLHQLAASDNDQPIQFLASRANPGGAKRVPKSSDYMYTFDHPATITVPARPLDSLFVGRTFDTILMDIEGSEYFALRGMPLLLARAKNLIVEFVPHHLKNIAGIGVSEFLAAIEPGGFLTVYAPSIGRTVAWNDAEQMLSEFYHTDTEDEGLIFSR